jgi:hypothetical protein
MEIKEFENTTNQILQNLSDQGKVSEYLQQLSEAYKTSATANQSFEQTLEKNNKEIDTLKETNMNLFLKINQQPEQIIEGQAQQQQPEPKTYDNLLKEMGVNNGN